MIFQQHAYLYCYVKAKVVTHYTLSNHIKNEEGNIKNADEKFKQALRIGSVVLGILLQLLFMTAGPPQSAQAAPGDLDMSFNGTSKVLTDFGGSNDAVHAYFMNEQGKEVIETEKEALKLQPDNEEFK